MHKEQLNLKQLQLLRETRVSVETQKIANDDSASLAAPRARVDK